MKRLHIIIFVSLMSSGLFGQVKQSDYYSVFQKNKPKYKKSVVMEAYFSFDDEPIDTFVTNVHEWTNNEFKTTTFYQLHYGSCDNETTVYVYNPDKRNSLTTKHFSCEKLTAQYYKLKYTDSVITYKSDTLISKSIHNKTDNSWTSFYRSGKKIKDLWFEDSIKTISAFYENDTLVDKTVTYKQRNLVDSFFVFDGKNKLITKVIEKFNKNNDLTYEERTDSSENPTKIIKSTFIYVYDKNGCWIEKSEQKEYFPKDDVKRVKKKLIRTLMY